MQGTIGPYATMTITWDANYERLLSPDGTVHLLPCEKCGKPEWHALNVVTFICDPCTKKFWEGE